MLFGRGAVGISILILTGPVSSLVRYAAHASGCRHFIIRFHSDLFAGRTAPREPVSTASSCRPVDFLITSRKVKPHHAPENEQATCDIEGLL